MKTYPQETFGRLENYFNEKKVTAKKKVKQVLSGNKDYMKEIQMES